MGEMEGMGKRGTLVHQELRGRKVKKVVVSLSKKKVNKEIQVFLVPRGRGEWLVLVGQLGRRVKKETPVCEEVKENQGLKEYVEREA